MDRRPNSDERPPAREGPQIRPNKKRCEVRNNQSILKYQWMDDGAIRHGQIFVDKSSKNRRQGGQVAIPSYLSIAGIGPFLEYIQFSSDTESSELDGRVDTDN
jgi:hypothetical protein